MEAQNGIQAAEAEPSSLSFCLLSPRSWPLRALCIKDSAVVFPVQSLSHVQLFVTPWTAAHQASLSFTVSWSLLKLMSIELVILSNHLIVCLPLFLLPSIFPSTRLLSIESALHIRWPKYWSFSISPSNGYSGLIFFRIDWFILLVVQEILKSLLQHRNLKASKLYFLGSVFFHWNYEFSKIVILLEANHK